MDRCECEKPTPWEDIRGKKTNVCKECGNKIEEHRPPELGRLHTRLDAALLGDHDLDPDHPFITWMAETAREDVRQKKLTWDHNRQVEARQRASVKPT